MDKKIIAAITIVAIIAIVIIVVNPFKPPEQIPPDENADLIQDENLYGPLDYFTPEELAAHDTQLQQSDPVRYNALQQNDIGICEQEKDASDIGWCKAAVAEKLKDESVCPALEGGARNQCYNDVARATGKLELCRNITSTDWKYECIAKLASTNNNLDACDEIIDPDWNDTCIAQIAMDRNDTSVCSQVKDEFFRQDCETNITG